jgi:hypothetical protein
MPDNTPAESQPSVASLVGGLIEDTQRLIRQEVALAKRGVEEEWEKTKEGAALMAGALALFTLVAILFGFTLVKLLHQYVLPNHEWACFAIVTGGFAVGGALLLYAGLTKFKQVDVVPQQSVDSIRQDVQAITDAVTSDRPQASSYTGTPRR